MNYLKILELARELISKDEINDGTVDFLEDLVSALQGYFETFWKKLHPQGLHPGLSEEDDSIFRFNIVQIFTMEILRRFDESYNME